MNCVQFTRAVAVFSCMLILAGCAGARHTVGPIGDRPERVQSAPEKVRSWSEKVRFGPGRAIYFRNMTERTVRITLIGLYKCVNVLGGCVTTRPENLIIGPKQTVEGLVVLPQYPHSAFDFKWHYQWEVVRPALVQAPLAAH